MSKAKKVLNKSNLRPTKQRIAIMEFILQKNKVHVTASKLIKHLRNKNINISLATIYNNLNELADKGVLKKFYVNNDKMWFDTNLQDHYHFYDSERDELIDIDKNEIAISKHPEIPSGKIKDSINIIINLKNKD